MLALFFLGGVLRSYLRVRREARARSRNSWVLTASYLVLAGLFGSWAGAAFLARGHPDGGVVLSFPLTRGLYYVAQGGSRLQLNHHQVSRAQRFALDVVRLNTLGFRAAGLQPGDHDRYFIFGLPVVSPCDGRVVAAHYGDSDEGARAASPQHPAGNFVAIRCQGVEVFLAHLQKGPPRFGPGTKPKAARKSAG